MIINVTIQHSLPVIAVHDIHHRGSKCRAAVQLQAEYRCTAVYKWKQCASELPRPNVCESAAKGYSSNYIGGVVRNW